MAEVYGYVDQFGAWSGSDDAGQVGAAENRDVEFTTERDALVGGESARLAAEEAATAKARLEGLRSSSAKWSQVMNDRIAEVSNEVNFEFREAPRLITRDDDEQLDAHTGARAQIVGDVVADLFIGLQQCLYLIEHLVERLGQSSQIVVDAAGFDPSGAIASGDRPSGGRHRVVAAQEPQRRAAGRGAVEIQGGAETVKKKH